MRPVRGRGLDGRVAGGIACAALLLAACAPEAPAPVGPGMADATDRDPTAEPADTPETEPSAPDTPEGDHLDAADAGADELAVAPLTGRERSGPPSDDPVLAVKVDNDPKARPQVGLDSAGVVFVQPVEGVTRLIALFHDELPGAVGPVRSARIVDAVILAPFAPVLAMSGAAHPAYDALEAESIFRVADDERIERGLGDEVFDRDGARPAPHNLFVDTAAALELGSQAGLPQAEDLWPRADEPPAGGTAAAGVDLTYGPVAGSSGWRWDGEEGAWTRQSEGEPHTDHRGRPLTSANVLVVRVEVNEDPTRPIDVVGTQDMTLLRDGVAFDGTWTKDEPGDHFAWWDGEGGPLDLAPGNTWVELVPSDGDVQVR